MVKPSEYKKTLFVNPPFIIRGYNSVGIARLRGYLNSKNIESSVIDLNVIFCDRQKSDSYLSSAIAELENYVTKKLLLINGMDIYLYKYHEKPLNNLLSLYVKCYSEDLEDLIKKFNFSPILKKYFPKDLNIDYLGFSVAYPCQFVFTMILADYIKKNIKKDIKIILGGYSISSNINELMKYFIKNPIIDYMVVGDGQSAIYELLSGNKKLKFITNLVYLDGLKYKKSENQNYAEDIGALPPPMHEPGDIPGIQAISRCYWNKCSFCRYELCQNKKIIIRPVDDVIHDIKNISKSLKDPKALYYFTDHVTPVPFLKEFFIKITEDKNLPRKYRVYSRLEPALNRQVLELAKSAGFDNQDGGQIIFGLETSINRLLKLINKGIDIKVAERILCDCADLNINVGIQLILGLPTQTAEDFFSDMDFCLNIINKYSSLDNITVTVNSFKVFYGTDIYHNPEKYRIKLLKKQKDFLHTEIPYKQLDKDALSFRKMMEIASKFINELPPEKRKCFEWLLTPNRFDDISA